MFCIRRREDVPEDEFHRYWLDEHGPLVRSVADAIGAVGYVQSHTVSPELNAFLRQSRDSAERYDGITEVWWSCSRRFRPELARRGASRPSNASWRTSRSSSTSARWCVFMTEEHVIFGDEVESRHAYVVRPAAGDLHCPCI